MREIVTTVDIGASAETVWRVLTDFPFYPKWNPFICAIEGRIKEKERLKLRMRLPKGRLRRFYPVIVRAIPAAELHWRDTLLFPGLYARLRAFIIVPQGLKGVRLIHRERFSGFLAPFILPFISKKTRQAFDAMNFALKRVAEKRPT